MAQRAAAKLAQVDHPTQCMQSVLLALIQQHAFAAIIGI